MSRVGVGIPTRVSVADDDVWIADSTLVEVADPGRAPNTRTWPAGPNTVTTQAIPATCGSTAASGRPTLHGRPLGWALTGAKPTNGPRSVTCRRSPRLWPRVRNQPQAGRDRVAAPGPQGRNHAVASDSSSPYGRPSSRSSSVRVLAGAGSLSRCHLQSPGRGRAGDRDAVAGMRGDLRVVGAGATSAQQFLAGAAKTRADACRRTLGWHRHCTRYWSASARLSSSPRPGRA